MKDIIIKIFILLALPFSIQSQSTMFDSIQYITSIKAARDLYRSSVKENYFLYNGREYYKKKTLANSFPFFESQDMLNGTIDFNNRVYPDVQLYYDISTDQIVINDYGKNNLIALQAEMVSRFTIDGHEFFRLDSNESKIGNGFYERLCKGNTSLWARHEKRMEQTTTLEGIDSKYVALNKYFLLKGNIFFSANNKKSLINLLKNKEPEIKKFIRSNSLDFKKHFEEAASQVVSYYNQLSY